MCEGDTDTGAMAPRAQGAHAAQSNTEDRHEEQHREAYGHVPQQSPCTLDRWGCTDVGVGLRLPAQ